MTFYECGRGMVSGRAKTLSISCWNIEGLYKYKFDLDALNYIKRYQICGFCETWGVCEEQFDNFVDNYTSFSSIRKKICKVGRFSGGGGALPFSYEMNLLTWGLLVEFLRYAKTL